MTEPMPETGDTVYTCHLCVRSAPHKHGHNGYFYACHIPYQGCMVTACTGNHDQHWPELRQATNDKEA